MPILKRSKSKKAGRETTGRVEEALGFATGDRHVEAEGHPAPPQGEGPRAQGANQPRRDRGGGATGTGVPRGLLWLIVDTKAAGRH